MRIWSLLQTKIMETLLKLPANYLKDRKYSRNFCLIKYNKMDYFDLITNS